MTIPTLMNKTQEKEYKTAYKKAYSGVSQALQRASTDYNLESFAGTLCSTGGEANFAALKSYFSAAKTCDNTHLSDCWASTGELYRGEIAGALVQSFIDPSGAAWRLRNLDSSSGTPTILVDTNGNKKPNKYGQDRFVFWFGNSNGTITGTNCGDANKIIVPDDATDSSNSYNLTVCPSIATHPCYNSTWLFQ